MALDINPPSGLYLVTGGAGFIGSNLTQSLLSSGCFVRILDNLSSQVHGVDPISPSWAAHPRCHFLRGSVTDYQAFKKALDDVDYVVHLAAETGTGQSMYSVSHYNNVNVLGTANLFDILANSSHQRVKKVILASSRAVYGEGAYQCAHCSPGIRNFPPPRLNDSLRVAKWDPLCVKCNQPMDVLPTKESDATIPSSIYGFTKLAQEGILRVCCESLAIDYVVLRLQNVYGEGQSLSNPYTGLISIFSTRIRQDLYLPLFEDGLESRDFVHVKDVVEVILRCLFANAADGQVINVGSGVGVSVRDVAHMLSVSFGFVPDIKVTGEYRLGDIRHSIADVLKMKELLGFLPQTRLADGLAKFCSWALTQELVQDKLAIANSELESRGLLSRGRA